MIYRTNANPEAFLQNLTTISTVIKEEKEQTEKISNNLNVPKILSFSPSFDIDIPANINLIGDNDLEELLMLNSCYRGTLDMAMLISPTNYSDKSFSYNGTFVSRTDPFYNTKVTYYLYNRLKIIHELLSCYGIITVLVTEPFLPTARMLLDEIFGKNNMICTHIVVSNKAGSSKNGVLYQHQYVLVYAKSIQSATSRNAYKVQENTLFCIEKKGVSSPLEPQNSTFSQRSFKDEISTFDLVSNVRSSKRAENANNYYPIYYIPEEVDSTGYDWNPILSLEPMKHPNEVVMYPKNNDGEDREWNTIPATFLRNYKASSYCVKKQNGVYKLYYKVRDNMSERNMLLEPIKTILDDGMSNLTTGNTIRKLMNSKEQFVGYNPNLAYSLLSAYSKEGDKILSVGDVCMTVYIAQLENQLNRTIFTMINENFTDWRKYLNSFLSEYSHQHQFINIGMQGSCGITDTTLDFVELIKHNQEPIAILRYGGISKLDETDAYTIYETRNYDIIVTMKIRYDLEVYISLNKKLKELKQEYAKIYIMYIDDSSYCQGEDIIKDAVFINMLQDYKTNYLTAFNKILRKEG